MFDGFFKSNYLFTGIELCILAKLLTIIHKKFIDMNTTELEGHWEEFKGKLKQKFANLTDDDLLFEEGKKDEILGKLQVKLGKSKEEFEKLIEEL